MAPHSWKGGAAWPLVALVLVGCAPAARVRSPLFAQLDAERTGPATRPVGTEADSAEVDALRQAAVGREDAGDPVAAELLLERARAIVARAIARQRTERAAARLHAATEGLAASDRDREEVESTLAAEVSAIDEAVVGVTSARAKARGAALEPVVGAREKARRLIAEATLLDAAEMCAFARTLGVRSAALERASALVRAAEKRAGTGTVLLESAAQARGACLALTAPEGARQAERRVTELDRGVELAGAMGLEAARDAVSLTFVLDDSAGQLEALAAFVRAYGGVALVVERRNAPGLPTDVQSAGIVKALGAAEGVLRLAPRVPLGEESKRRLVVRVAPRPVTEPAEAPATSEEP